MDLNLINTDLVTVEDMDFIQELDTYEFPERVYRNYICTTNDNKNLTYEQVRRKLIRDIILGKELPKREGITHKRVFSYGNMLIHLNTIEKSICYIKNIKSGIDRDKRRVLNEIMGIEDIYKDTRYINNENNTSGKEKYLEAI